IAELEAYLSATGLQDYTLTKEEQKALEEFESLKWDTFNLEKLFGKSTRGRRLKSADRISGDLPFVTAGETDTGISDFIGNKVIVFSDNTTTIDMFGSAKYRNYKYGGDDHIAVVHTENLSKYASIFVTSAIHKSSYNGQFNYGRNFYAKDADELNIMLPTDGKNPNYKTMDTLISAIKKLVIKDVVLYADRKIEATKKIIKNR
ncbi:MAG: restriction endonuclease, partial [Fusobacteria bacterium]|nr:restriction endonuclease [Fusobacteriota bacterium]